MTVADTRIEATTARIRTTSGLRLVWLHVTSRRIPSALAALAACAAILRAALVWRWIPAGGGGQLQIPALLEAGAAAVIAVASHSPFGDVERATGRWLPWLRAGTAIALTAAAIGALAAGVAAAGLDGGVLGIVRDLVGLTGIGLLSAVAFGGLLAWIGPMAYLVLTEAALVQQWTTPWTWIARPPGDRGAAICAAAVFAVGLLIIAIRGPRDRAGD